MPKIASSSTPKVIGIVGSRRRNTVEDANKCLAAFRKVYREGDRIVSGGCPQGGDKFAENIARMLGLTIIIHYPDWDAKGKSAGLQRNTQIAEDADVLIALVHPDRTGGTEDTVKKFLALGKDQIIYA